MTAPHDSLLTKAAALERIAAAVSAPHDHALCNIAAGLRRLAGALRPMDAQAARERSAALLKAAAFLVGSENDECSMPTKEAERIAAMLRRMAG